MCKNILVCFLFTEFDNTRELINFVKHYKKYSSGASHKLLICLIKILSAINPDLYIVV